MLRGHLLAAPFSYPDAKDQPAHAGADIVSVACHWSTGNVLRATTGESASVLVQCGGDGSANPTNKNVFLSVAFAVSGNTLTLSVPLSALPRQVRAGTVLRGHQAVVDLVDPVTGSRVVEGPTAPGVLDTASTSGSWKIS